MKLRYWLVTITGLPRRKRSRAFVRQLDAAKAEHAERLFHGSDRHGNE